MSHNENDPWCKALHDCTVCLREQNVENVNLCLAKLSVLEQKLGQEMDTTAGSTEAEKENRFVATTPKRMPPSWNFLNDETMDDTLELATDQEVATTSKLLKPNRRHGTMMNTQRLLARIQTYQSEAFCLKATHAAKILKEWTMASNYFETSISKIHSALNVLDTAISEWWMSYWKFEDNDDEDTGEQILPNHHEQDLLKKDASVVVVALESLGLNRDKLLQICRREEDKLLRKLKPQWEARDRAKQRMGSEQWNNNRRPKSNYYQMRAELEKELKGLQTALKSLEELNPHEALQKASDLKEQLLLNNSNNKYCKGKNPLSRKPLKPLPLPTSSFEEQQRQEHQLQQHRYNNQRPSQEWMGKRVSLELYPDPVNFGWTFTGSWQAVEFFERPVVPTKSSLSNNLVKLDWYFTTGTIKTSLDHPVQGRTQLFAKKCNPETYAEVLTNPRTHTGERYQRKPPPNSNKNRNKNHRRNRPQKV